jgi:hypothetical protein
LQFGDYNPQKALFLGITFPKQPYFWGLEKFNEMVKRELEAVIKARLDGKKTIILLGPSPIRKNNLNRIHPFGKEQVFAFGL